MDFNHPSWGRRDIKVLREKAWAWKNAQTQAERDQIFEEYGVHWSKYWHSPYWDPTRMLVINGMHCVLEGLMHYHCRKVLRVDAVVAKKKERGPMAFEQDWRAYNPSQVPPAYLLKAPAKEGKQIFSIQSRLVAPFVLEDGVEPVAESLAPRGDEDQEMPPVPESNETPVPTSPPANDSDAVEKLRKALQSKNLLPLCFVCYSLGLNISAAKLKKADYAEKLITWRVSQSLAGFDHDWVSCTGQVAAPYQLKNPAVEEPQVPKIQSLLMAPLSRGESEVVSDAEGDEGPIAAACAVPASLTTPSGPDPIKVKKAVAALTKALKSYNLSSLRFVAYSLGLDMNRPNKKSYYAAKLTDWRLTKPLVNPHFVSRAIDLTKLKFIQCVIANTSTPAWVHSVPKNYGESNTGTIKADKWCILSTLYLPIALILLWGDLDREEGEPTKHLVSLECLTTAWLCSKPLYWPASLPRPLRADTPRIGTDRGNELDTGS
ncbi:hypothetical protein B0H16DRAFT_1725140 [Mycena metata]|uniref:Uncharacterized protein n=1 Tax=Mycena metata TaxID=1033252 RepID=A0AAD7IS29_9AGAR|nr:hypothetical protein B0H16DRAFT_1725140 [Mycena metata]